MAELDIAERRLPQDGRIELNVGGNSVDLRVSVLPTLFGESVVMRVLDRTVVQLDLNKIGMDANTLTRFRKTIITRPNGIVLVTGPTGSGKTTTLYSALNELNDIETKIITTEDPIEYDIDGLIQVPVNPDIEVTFATVLRAILRHDPGHDSGRRNSRLRNGRNRRPKCADRAPGVQHAAHQRRPHRRSPDCATWGSTVPDHGDRRSDSGSATGPPDLRRNAARSSSRATNC